MVGSDVVVIGLQSNEQITVTDQFMPAYGRPVVDEQQDIFDVEVNISPRNLLSVNALLNSLL